MVISVSDTFTHKAVCEKKTKINQKKLQKIVLKSIKKSGLKSSEVSWNEHGHLELKHADSLKLHSLMLQMEKLGLDLSVTKQTLIKIA
ncbi:MAG: hypothetical protein ACJAT4_001604 [Granulosicoccus sp.]|jgi:hypothetical protein